MQVFRQNKCSYFKPLNLGMCFKSIIYLFLAVLGLHCCVGFSLVVASGGCSSLQCMAFLLWWFPLLWSTGSGGLTGFIRCGSWAPEEGLSSWGAWAWLHLSMWNLSGPRTEPMSPPLAGGFSPTVQPGKSCSFFYKLHFPMRLGYSCLFI